MPVDVNEAERLREISRNVKDVSDILLKVSDKFDSSGETSANIKYVAEKIQSITDKFSLTDFSPQSISDTVDLIQNIAGEFSSYSKEAAEIYDVAGKAKRIADIFQNFKDSNLTARSVFDIVSEIKNLAGSFNPSELNPEKIKGIADSVKDIADKVKPAEALNDKVSKIADKVNDIAGNVRKSPIAGALVDSEYKNSVTFDINPDSISDDKQTNFANIEIPAMSHPRLQFTAGNERTLAFTVYLHHGATKNVPAAIKCLQSWLYPEYQNGKLSKAPEKLLLVFGTTWQGILWVMKSCNVSMRRFDRELNCVFAQADIELSEFISESRDAKDVRT